MFLHILSRIHSDLEKKNLSISVEKRSKPFSFPIFTYYLFKLSFKNSTQVFHCDCLRVGHHIDSSPFPRTMIVYLVFFSIALWFLYILSESVIDPLGTILPFSSCEQLITSEKNRQGENFQCRGFLGHPFRNF